MRDVIAGDRELSPSEVRRVQLRQREVVHRLHYVIVGARRYRRVTTLHHIGDVKR